ncbi:PA14 domain-containing protein [uncultured Hymenobacter sp.]|uniref:PA14 domain-containing protein n=1 Tax=uncultured Hymenobacter sp. TaxID=170016 RepID=UPI0035CA68A4
MTGRFVFRILGRRGRPGVLGLAARVAGAAFAFVGSRPAAAQSEPEALPLGDGLRAIYYQGVAFNQMAGQRVDRAIDFDWSFRAPQAGYPAGHFSVRWTGYLYAPLTGTYTFRIITDDGMRVWVGGRLLLDEWRPQPPLTATGWLALRAGHYYPVRIEYFQEERMGRAFLGWDLPGDPPAFSADAILPADGRNTAPPAPRPIDQGYLFTYLPAPPKAWPVSRPAGPPKAVAALRGAGRLAPKRGRSPRPASAAGFSSTLRRPARPPAPAADLNAAAKGTTLPLPQLYFVQSTATLHVNSRPELERLAVRLRAAPAMRLEIAGHTDNVGDSARNVLLSYQRAAVVRAYLIGHGIDSARVTARGYGGARPIADNADPHQRPRNRRVEIIVR